MKTTKNNAIFIVVLILCSFLIPTALFAATYYVDSSGGNDSNNGTSTTTPWMTIAKINATILSAGDTVLFKRGGEWRETLYISSSGISGSLITFGAYGTGDKPIINGAKKIEGTWVNHSGNVWKIIVTGEPVVTPVTQWTQYFSDYPYWYNISATDTEPASLLFNGVAGTKMSPLDTLNETLLQKLTKDGDWCWWADYKAIFVYSSSNPASVSAVLPSPAAQIDSLWITNTTGGNRVIHWGSAKKSSLDQLTAEYDWYFDSTDNFLYLYISSNPNTETLVEYGMRQYGIYGYESSYITVSNLDIRFTLKHGICIETVLTNGSFDAEKTGRNWIVENNTVSYIGIGSTSDIIGIDVAGYYHIVRNNAVSECIGNGIYIGSGGRNTVEQNTAYNNHHHGIDVKALPGTPCEYNAVRHNLLYELNMAQNVYGLDENGNPSNKTNAMFIGVSNYTLVEGNISTNCQTYGIQIGGGIAESRADNASVYNNVVINAGSSDYYIDNFAYNVKMKNNIGVNSGYTDSLQPHIVLWISRTTYKDSANNDIVVVSECDYNDWFCSSNNPFLFVNNVGYYSIQSPVQDPDWTSYKSITGLDQNSIIADPHVNIAFTPPYLNLQSTSPCINAGTGVVLTGWGITAPKDFDGTSIPQGSGPDIGAYEYQVPVINYDLSIDMTPAGVGSVARDPTGGSYPDGTTVALTASALISGYTFSSWSGVDSSSGPTANVIMNANKSVTATFTINTYTINASAGANGAISPNGATTVNYDASQAYTITPTAGYTIDTITVDGAAVSNPQLTHTFSAVKDNHTIAVTFKQAVPAAPIGLTATAASTTSVTLKWTDKASNEKGYKIERKTGAGGTYAVVNTTTTGSLATIAEASTKTGDTTYYYRICAYNDAGNSVYSNEVSVTTINKPASLTARVTSPTTVVLTWPDSSTVNTGYKVYRRVGSTGSYTTIATVGDVTIYTDITAAANTTYTYLVKGYSGSNLSTYASAAANTAIPAAPTSLILTVYSTTQINLSWTDNAPGFAGFKIFRSTTSTCPADPIATLAINTVTYSDTGRSPNTKYYYWVKAHSSESMSAAVSGNKTTALIAPTNLQYTASARTITLTWGYEPTETFTGFKITRTGTSSKTITVTDINARSKSDTVTSAGTYTYKIRAYKTVSAATYYSAYTATVTATVN